ncbi:beta-lactamase domain-containing protein [Purpureocillium lavendulum]|uniref:Beta-lactamase domain-containing protein n=1 Tax=Purpureocillium lavendulum TaxID=1247861 RepID=A0AB34FIP6_9HYPO|nr:beta-lactamase domain-containing protein [Purpureocillium lavendulum]
MSPPATATSASEDANRGFIGTIDPGVITGQSGREVWNCDAYGFFGSVRPPTVNEKLWNHSKLTALHGLYEVLPGIYQVRGFDISNMTLVEGKTGVVVVDPLTSNECAAAALSLYQSHRGKRPVVGIIYSHSHIDHFGGAMGILPKDKEIPIIAPDRFVEEAMSENTLAGPAMMRRAAFMYGTPLPPGPGGRVGVGIGVGVSTGNSSLVPPNKLIKVTGEVVGVDGIEMVFQTVPGTEAPAEINFYIPAQKALYISECATQSLHNIITLRGALVRDAKAWSGYLDETIDLYGRQSEVLFAGHTWPTWGNTNIMRHVSEQRDLYAYLHDQTLRLMNLGLNGTEIAEQLTLPPQLRDAPHAQGYYGSVSHNIKGIYQRYMTWFDGNPAHLWAHPPAEEGRRYVECFGGVQELVKKAQGYADAGDLRFAATLLDHAVKADPQDKAAKMALAFVYGQLGFGAENATWRNFYLTGAAQLRSAVDETTVLPDFPALNPLGTVDQWLDCLSIRVDGPKAAAETLVIDIKDPASGAGWRVRLSNGALTHRHMEQCSDPNAPDLVLTLKKEELLAVLNGDFGLAQSKASGDCDPLKKLLSLCGM